MNMSGGEVRTSIAQIPVAAGTVIPPSIPTAVSERGFRFRKSHALILLLLVLFVGLPIWCVIGVTGYFRLSSEGNALRASLAETVGGHWHKKIAVRVGGLTTGLVRFGTQFIHMPPEPRVALNSLQGGEVGIYELEDGPDRVNSAAILSSADRAMKSRGWERVVGVAQERELVAVYLPEGKLRETKMSCCVLVVQERQAVIVSARGNVEGLVEMARKKIDWERLKIRR